MTEREHKALLAIAIEAAAAGSARPGTSSPLPPRVKRPVGGSRCGLTKRPERMELAEEAYGVRLRAPSRNVTRKLSTSF